MRYQVIDGKMTRVREDIIVVSEAKKADYVWRVPEIKKHNSENIVYNSNKGVYAKSSVLASLVPLAVVATDVNQGIFWNAFLTYIFPYMMDIAKVFCAIKIAQAFYSEKRGGRDEGTGVGAFVTYGKWYLLFSVLPWAVELIDQLGSRMLNDLGQ